MFLALGITTAIVAAFPLLLLYAATCVTVLLELKDEAIVNITGIRFFYPLPTRVRLLMVLAAIVFLLAMAWTGAFVLAALSLGPGPATYSLAVLIASGVGCLHLSRT